MPRAGVERRSRMQPNIVIVDDDPLQLTIMSLFLKKAGFERLSLFDSPVEALGYARRRAPDLVITDYNMPELTGVQLLRRLHDIYPDLPAVVVSGSDIDFDYPQIYAVVQKGSEHYFPKLIAYVRSALNSKREVGRQIKQSRFA